MGNDGKEGAVWPPVGKQTTARLAKPGLQPPPGVEHSRGPWTVVFARGEVVDWWGGADNRQAVAAEDGTALSWPSDAPR